MTSASCRTWSRTGCAGTIAVVGTKVAREATMSTVRIQMDAELERLVDAQVAESGQSRDEVIAAALRRGLGEGGLRASLSQSRRATAASDDEAMQIALAEVKAARGQRRTA